LGPQKNFELVRPGQFRCAVINASLNTQNFEIEEDDPEEQLPNPSLPPFEPLVLWSGQDERDPTIAHKIEVSINILGPDESHVVGKFRSCIIWPANYVHTNEKVFNFFSNALWAYVVSKVKVVFLQMIWSVSSPTVVQVKAS